MKYLSLLPALLLMYGNCSFAMEDVDSCQQSKMEPKKNNGEEKINNTGQKVREMEKRHRRGRIRTTQQEPMFDNSVTITVDGETQKI